MKWNERCCGGEEGYKMFHVKHFERKIGDEIGEVRRECVWGTE